MRLADCFSELMAYTVCLLKEIHGGQPSYSEVAERYEKLVDRARMAKDRAGFSDMDWKECFFAVCAWIDEMILCSDWPDREKWQERQLQHSFLGTTNAGQEFFDHLALLSPKASDIREVYDLCLSMGFKGRYFMPEDKDALKEINQSNYAVLTEGSRGGEIASLGEFTEIQHLFPEAYAVETKKGERSFGLLLLACFFAAVPVFVFVVLYMFFQGQLSWIVSNYFH